MGFYEKLSVVFLYVCFGFFFLVIIRIWEGRGQLESKVNIVKTVPEQHQSGKCSQIYSSKVLKGCLFSGKFSRLFKTHVSCSFFGKGDEDKNAREGGL